MPPELATSAVRTPPPVERGQRGRPTRARAEAINGLIVETARTMFLANGYGATAMEVIAMGAGVSKGTLYSRYPSKADLFAAVVEDRVRAWSAKAPTYDATLPGALASRLEHHVRVAIENLGDPEVSGFATMMLAARRQFPELAQIYFDRAVLHQIGLVARDIADAPEGASIADPQAMAFALLEAAVGWSLIRAMNGGRFRTEQIHEAARDIVARSLGAVIPATSPDEERQPVA